jgi:cell division protease FtsH
LFWRKSCEEIIFGKDDISTGAGGGSGSDINQATQLARAMVTKYGMSDVMGPVEYGENQEEVFLGRSVTQTQSVSEETSQKIDKEIRKLIDEGYNQAKKILTEKIDDLHKIAKALMTYETLTGEEIENIISKNLYPKDKIIEKPEENDDQNSALGAMGLKPKIVH